MVWKTNMAGWGVVEGVAVVDHLGSAPGSKFAPRGRTQNPLIKVLVQVVGSQAKNM